MDVPAVQTEDQRQVRSGQLGPVPQATVEEAGLLVSERVFQSLGCRPGVVTDRARCSTGPRTAARRAGRCRRHRQLGRAMRCLEGSTGCLGWGRTCLVEAVAPSYPARFTFYLHEFALRLPVGGPVVMVEQWEHLLRMSRRSYLTLRVVPAALGGTPESPGRSC